MVASTPFGRCDGAACVRSCSDDHLTFDLHRVDNLKRHRLTDLGVCGYRFSKAQFDLRHVRSGLRSCDMHKKREGEQTSK